MTQADVAQVLRRVRLEPQRGLIASESLRVLRLGEQHAPHRGMVGRNRGAELKRPGDKLGRARIVLALISQDPEQVPGIGALRLASQHALV